MNGTAPDHLCRKAPILVVDIGNSSTDLGLYAGGTVKHIGRTDTAGSTQRRIRAVIRAGTGQTVPARAVLASVVPEICEAWGRAVRATCGCDCLWVNPRLDIGVPIPYPDPETLGADRLANVSGAVARFGSPVIVADFGTALTVDVVEAGHGFVGGVIAPGLPLMIDYLAERTAKLPQVGLRPVRRAVGRSTEESMRIGARYGYPGMVRGILERVLDELGSGSVTVCATGGNAEWVLRGLDPGIRRVPNLTLLGLGRIGDLNEGL